MYPNDDACLHQVFLNRFGSQNQCYKCKKSFSCHKVSDRKCYACAFCGHQIHPLAGTIFHKSKTTLKNWFFAIFLFSVSKNGVSAKELERQLGVTYKCAYRIGQQITKLFATGDLSLKRIVEVDETYCGGKEDNKHKDKKIENTQECSVKTKTPIIGIIERQGQIVAKVVKNTKSKTILEFVKKMLKKEVR